MAGKHIHPSVAQPQWSDKLLFAHAHAKGDDFELLTASIIMTLDSSQSATAVLIQHKPLVPALLQRIPAVPKCG